MNGGRGFRPLPPGLVLVFMVGLPISAEACRLLPNSPENEKVFHVHLEGPCLPEEQQALAVKGRDVLEALEQGKNVDLQGVLVVDDMMLDLLPLHDISEIATMSPAVRAGLQERHIAKAHVIPGSLSIRDSRVEKVLATNLETGALVIIGALDFTGTVFHQSVDFSKTVFTNPVTVARMRVEYETFFIDAEFHQSADFSDVIFGTHSRFHSAAFHDQVTFAGARFAGVAELLEVEFHQGADFSRSYFAGGTGFSGSVFEGLANFSGVRFTHEIYFRFTEFHQPVSFRHTTFHHVVDFTKARFDGGQNFSGVVFHTPPDTTGSNIDLPVVAAQWWRTRQAQFGLFAGLVILVVVYVWASKRRRGR